MLHTKFRENRPAGSGEEDFGMFLAHMSRRLIGELIVYRSSRRPCVRPWVCASVRLFTLSNMNISATSWPIGMKFYLNSGFHGNI